MIFKIFYKTISISRSFSGKKKAAERNEQDTGPAHAL